MTATLNPSMNGKIVLTRKGLAEFQFGDDGLSFIVDVLQTYDDFCEGEWEFCDENNRIVKEKRTEWRKWRQDFVQAILNDAYRSLNPGVDIPTLTRAETEAFIAKIMEETNKLRPFTNPGSSEKPSSPEGTEIRFSQ